ncbi:MAG: hypothetical protein ACI91J_000271 [Yoonia sp.]|jgi:hypothetical protein
MFFHDLPSRLLYSSLVPDECRSKLHFSRQRSIGQLLFRSIHRTGVDLFSDVFDWDAARRRYESRVKRLKMLGSSVSS